MKVLLFILFFLSLTGCGGGGGSSDTGTTSPPIDPPIDPPVTILKTVSGSVIDGPVTGAVVCLDSNSDLSCDGEQYNTTTDDNGAYALDIPEDADTSLNLISVGGVDGYTTKAVQMTFVLKLHYLNQFDSTANFITPVSTLVSSLYETLLLNTSLSETDRINYLGYFTDNMYIDPLLDNDVFVANQEVLLAFAFYNAYELEQSRTTISLWQAADNIAKLSGLQYRINTITSYKTSYDVLYSAVRTRLINGEEQAVVQNFLLQSVEALSVIGTNGMTGLLASKVMIEHKSITLEALVPTFNVQYNYINMQWPAVDGATEYSVYLNAASTSLLTTQNNYITIPIPYNFLDSQTLTYRVVAENAVQVSPESSININARGVSNARPPYLTNITASKGDEKINVCFDFPEIDILEWVGSNQFYYKAYLYIKDNDKGFRNAGRFDIRYDPTVVDNRYCFAPLNMSTTKPVEFQIQSHLSDREGNYEFITLPSNDFGYASSTSGSTLSLSAFGSGSTATLIWSNVSNASEYVVYLSDSASMSGRSELFRSYSTKTSFDLPYLVLKDQYYLQVEAILNDSSTQTSNIVSYDGFKNRLVIPRGVDNSTVNQYLFTMISPSPARNLTKSVHFAYAMNSDLPDVYSPSFETLGLDINGNATKVLFTDYSDVLKVSFVELGNTWEGWALGQPFIYSQGIYETITPDFNSVTDDDHDNVVNSNDLCLQTPLGQVVDGNGCSVYELSDSDGDSILNYLDSCLDTPAGYSVDINGCADFQLNDFDNDNVINGLDVCPHDTWDGVVVDYSTSTFIGCGSQEGADNDNDGIINFTDICTLTPINETADANGCSPSQTTDSDNDSIVNQYDLCPATPGPFIDKIDIHGCYIEEISDDDNDGIVNILDSCLSTPVSLSALADGCAAEEVTDDDTDGVANFYDECAATPASSYVLKNGCVESTKPDVNFIQCGRPVVAKPAYLLEWERQSAYDGYEVTRLPDVVRDYGTNTVITGSYLYRFSISVKPYYYLRTSITVDTQKSYGTAKVCDFALGLSVATSSIFSDPIVFTQHSYNTNSMDDSTTQTAAELPQQNVGTTIDGEAYMFVFPYNGYWWGAGPMQSVSTGYNSAEEVIALVRGETCAHPRKYVNDVTAMTNYGNEVTGTFFYCGKPLPANGSFENLDILKLYSFTSGL